MSQESPSAATGRVIDLSGSSIIRQLVEKRCRLMAAIGELQDELASVDAVIKATLGEHEEATLPGWTIQYPVIHRRACLIPAGEYRRLVIKEVTP